MPSGVNYIFRDVVVCNQKRQALAARRRIPLGCGISRQPAWPDCIRRCGIALPAAMAHRIADPVHRAPPDRRARPQSPTAEPCISQIVSPDLQSLAHRAALQRSSVPGERCHLRLAAGERVAQVERRRRSVAGTFLGRSGNALVHESALRSRQRNHTAAVVQASGKNALEVHKEAASSLCLHCCSTLSYYLASWAASTTTTTLFFRPGAPVM